MAYTVEDFSRGVRGALREARLHGLDPAVADAHAWATGVLAYYGYTEPDRPDIISGRRDPEHQRRLIHAWDSGDRRGLTTRPAVRSWHLLGRAVDVETAVRGFLPYAWLLTFTGARDGRQFTPPDPGHFDWPSRSKPPSVYA